MNVHLNWTAVGVILAIISHALILVRGWTIIEFRLKAMADAFIALNKSLEERDKRVDAAWKKIDNHDHRITVIETKCLVEPKMEE